LRDKNVEYGCIFLLIPSLTCAIFSISWIIISFITWPIFTFVCALKKTFKENCVRRAVQIFQAGPYKSVLPHSLFFFLPCEWALVNFFSLLFSYVLAYFKIGSYKKCLLTELGWLLVICKAASRRAKYFPVLPTHSVYKYMECKDLNHSVVFIGGPGLSLEALVPMVVSLIPIIFFVLFWIFFSWLKYALCI